MIELERKRKKKHSLWSHNYGDDDNDDDESSYWIQRFINIMTMTMMMIQSIVSIFWSKTIFISSAVYEWKIRMSNNNSADYLNIDCYNETKRKKNSSVYISV